jgi:16S rRNA (guanine527-N7)-methyltransferase
MKEFLKENARQFGYSLSDEKLSQFEGFYNFLVEFNAHTNLIAKADEKTILTKHFVDSMAFGKVPVLSDKFRLLDVGSGGGFPVIPLAILYPDAEIFAVDSVGKKVNFLNEAALKVSISEHFKALNNRAEDLPVEFRESFDFVTARAVASLNTLLEYCLPFVKVGGFFVAYKAKTAKEELKESKNAIKILGGSLAEIIEYKLDDEIEHNLIIIEKISKTSAKYPRKAGLPKKNPL